MPRERSPQRDEAKRIWLESAGHALLKEIAAQLGVGDSQVRKWKSEDNWDGHLKGNVTNRPKSNVTKPKSKTRRQPSAEEAADELTEKQRIFIAEYMRDFNATRAAMAVGYSKKTAATIGWELLRKPEVQAEIKRQKEMVADELGISLRRVIGEYMKIAFTDITDLLDFGQKEVPVMSMFGPVKDEEGKPMTKIVNFVDFKESNEIDGTVISEVKQGKDGVSIKLHDKMRALKELEKYLGYMTEEERLRLEKTKLEIAALKRDEDEDDDEEDGLESLTKAIDESKRLLQAGDA